jgi:hypothetical protein
MSTAGGELLFLPVSSPVFQIPGLVLNDVFTRMGIGINTYPPTYSIDSGNPAYRNEIRL